MPQWDYSSPASPLPLQARGKRKPQCINCPDKIPPFARESKGFQNLKPHHTVSPDSNKADPFCHLLLQKGTNRPLVTQTLFTRLCIPSFTPTPKPFPLGSIILQPTISKIPISIFFQSSLYSPVPLKVGFPPKSVDFSATLSSADYFPNHWA